MKMLGMMRRWRGLLAAFGLLTLVALLPWGSRAERGVVGMEREVMAEQRGEGFGVESALSRGMMDAEGNAAGSVGIADAGAGRVAGGRGEAFSGGKPRKAEAQRTAQRVDARRLSGRRVRGGAPVLHIIKGPGVEEEFKIKTIGSDWSYDGATLYGDGAAIDGVVRFTVGQMSAGGTMYSEYRGPLGTYLVTVVRGEGSARELAVEENSVASGFSRWSVQEGNGSDIYVYVDKKVSIELKYRVDGQMNYELAPNELNVTYHGVRRVEWVHGGLGEFKDYVPQGAELHVKGVSGLVTLPDGKQAKLMSLVGGEQWLAGGPGQKGTSLEGTWKLPDNVSGGLEMVAVWRTDDETNRVVSFGVEGPGTMVVTDESGTLINNGQTLGSGVTALKVQATTNAGSELKGFLTNGRFFPLSGSVPAGGTRVSFPKEAKDVYLLTAFEKTRGEDPWWTITARGDIRNGKVELSAAEARENGYVLVTPHAAPGYMLTSLTYSYDGGRTTVDITQTRTIKMPAANVEVNAIFTKKPLKDVGFTVKNGSALADAAVTLVDGDGTKYARTTGPDGRAVFVGVSAPAEGTVTVRATVDGEAKVVTIPVTVERDGTLSPAELDFAKVRIYKVDVGVWNMSTLLPVPSAVITVGDQASEPTNSGGSASLYLVAGATYRVGVTAPGYSPLKDYELVVKADGTAHNSLPLYPLRSVSFGVKRKGAPVVGATVTLVDGEGTPYEGRTDASGVAQVPSVAAVPVPASGTITVMTQEGERVTVPVKVDVSGNATPSEIDLSGANAGGVKVRVVDAATGAGIQDAVVAVSTLTEGVSDGEGYVTLHLLKGAKYFAVRTSATGYSPLNVVLTVDGNGAVTPGEIALEKRGVKNVTVRVIDNVANVAGARVTLVDGDGKFYEAVTDGNGEATVKDVPVPTEGTVTVEKDGKVLTVPVTVDETGKADPATIDLNQNNGVWINIFDKVLVEPIEGAVVTVGAQVSDRSTIAGGGMVLLRLARGAKYSIKVSAPGYKDSILDLLIQPGGSADPNFIYLVRKGQKDVTVQVVDGNGNVEGAAVTIVDTDGRSYPAITGADGRAAMKDVPTPTAGTVTVEKDGKVVTVPVKVFPDGWMTPTPVSIAEENVRAVTVRVVEEGSDPAKPIVGATVTVGAQAVQTTAPNGEATLRLIGKAEYPAVLATATGYDSRSVELTVDGNGAASPAVIALAKKARKDVKLGVVEGSDKVFGAEVTIADADGTIYRKVTDANGEVVVPKVLAPTQWLVTVEVSSVQIKKTVRVDVNADGVASPSTIDIGVNPLVVSLTVVDRQTGGPIEGAEVAIGTDRSVTEASGEVAFLLGADGIYRVRASAAGYEEAYVDLAAYIQDEKYHPNKIELRKKAKSSVEVTVTDNGANVAGATVTIVDNDGKSHAATTDGNGGASVQDVPVPTVGTVTVEKDGKVVTVPVTVDEHGTMTPRAVDISDADARGVALKVVDSDTKQPIAGATVTVGAQAVQTGTTGEATLRLLKGVSYPVVKAEATGYKGASVAVAVDGNGKATPGEIALEMRSTMINVIRYSAPVAGATVTIVDGNGNARTGITDSYGYAQVKVLAPTEGTVTVKTQDGLLVTLPIAVDDDWMSDPFSVEIITMSGKEVKVQVVEQGSGTSIEGATVIVGAQEVKTGANGEAILRLVGDKTYKGVKAEAAGYNGASVQLVVDSDGNPTPATIELERRVASVTVTVTDGGTSVDGATVTIVDNDGKSHAATSDGNGGASVQDVPVPTVGTVTVEKDGKVVTVPVTVAANGQMTPAMVDISDADAREVVLKVVDSDTKQPIARATVAIGAQAVQTGTTGEATLRLLKGVSYPMVKAEATGYNGTSVAVAVDGNGKATPGEIALEMRSTNISVTTDGSIPAVGATVTIVDGNGNAHAGVTDQHGDAKVKVSAPTAGTVTVKTQDGSRTITAPIAVDGDWVSDPALIVLNSFGQVMLKVAGRDTPSSTESVLPGATVAVGAQTQVSNAVGMVFLDLLYPSSGSTTKYSNVKISAVGYIDSTITLEVDALGMAHPNVWCLLKKPLKNVEVKVDGGATVTLVDSDGNSYTETDTDGNGEVVLSNVPAPTKGTVTVKTTDGKSVEVPVRVDKEGVMSPKDLTLHPVTVAVVDGQSHQPIKKATVTIGGQTSKTTGANGVATLYLVRGVTYTGVTAAAAGYLTSDEMEVAVDADGAATPDEIALTKKALVDVTVTVTDGVTNVGGATVTLVDVDGKEYQEVTDGNGEAVMPKVPVPTEGTVTVEKDGLVVTVPVTVDEHGVMTPGTVDISSADIATVTVTVVEKGTNVGLGGATVFVGSQLSNTGPSGETSLRLLKGKTYMGVSAIRMGYLPRTGVKLTVDAAGHANPGVIELEKKVLLPVEARVNPGATVTLVDSDKKSYTETDTDVNGEVTLPNVPVPTEGTVTVTATVDGETRKLEIPVTVDANGKMSPSDLRLHEVPVKVVEKNASPEVSIAGATVTVGVQKGTTNGDGVAKLYLVKGVTYEGVKAAAAGYEEAVVAELTVDTAGKADPRVIELEKKALADVKVKVNGGATVTLVDGDGKSYTETDTDGNKEVVLPNVPVPTVGTVTVSVDGKTVTVPVTVGKDSVMSPKDLTLHPVEIKVVEKGVSPEKTIAGATVTIGGQPSVETGADGVATLYLVWGVSYEKGAAARAGYSTATINKLAVDEHGATDPGVVELEKKALELVTVTVKDGTTNVEGATVTLISSDGTRYEEKTDGNGGAAIQDVPVPTEGTVTVEKDGKIVTVPVEVDADGNINPPVVNIAEANVWPVKVTVVEKGASPEVPIAGATVTVGAQTSAATGADGVATLYLVKDRTYKEVKAVAAGYEEAVVAELTVDPAGKADPREIELEKKAVKGVTVKVNESATVTLVDGAGNPHTATDSEARGEVSLPGVPVTTTGKVTVTATVGGETRKLEVPVTVDKDGTVHPGDLTLYPVTVKVVDSQSKQPIEGAKVTAGGQTSAAAGADGVVTLYLAKGLTYAEVKAGAAGYIDRSDITLSVFGQWPVVPGEIELVLKPRKPVTVSVDPGAKVTLVDGDGNRYTGTETGGSGTVTLPNVPVPTTGTVTVKTTDGKRVEVPVTVGADGTMNPSDLRLYQVNIYVVDKAGQPIEGATVTVGGQTSAATGANGVATLYLVGGVTYTGVKAEAVRYETTTVDELKVTVTTSGSATATPDRIEMLPQEPYLHVFVVDENLQAIEKVSVSVKEEGSKTTDSAGHAAWKLTAGKEYELTLEKEGYITVTAKVRLSELGHDLTVVMQREAKADPKKEDPKGQVTAVESALLAGASLYPNPAREYTTLHGLEHAEMVRILTLSGVEVQRLAVPGEREHKLDVSRLAEGIYLVVLETRGGERKTLKLVVRR